MLVSRRHCREKAKKTTAVQWDAPSTGGLMVEVAPNRTEISNRFWRPYPHCTFRGPGNVQSPQLEMYNIRRGGGKQWPVSMRSFKTAMSKQSMLQAHAFIGGLGIEHNASSRQPSPPVCSGGSGFVVVQPSPEGSGSVVVWPSPTKKKWYNTFRQPHPEYVIIPTWVRVRSLYISWAGALGILARGRRRHCGLLRRKLQQATPSMIGSIGNNTKSFSCKYQHT